MNAAWQDVRFAFRMMLKNPGLAGVVIVTLALGIGANAAIFSIVDAVVLRPLPFERPDRLVMLLETRKGEASGPGSTSYPNFNDWREQNQTFEEMGIFDSRSFTLFGAEAPERVTGGRVSAGFFPVLRVKPVLGRLFHPEDDLPGADNVVVLSHALWERRFGKDRSIVGQALTLDGTTFTVVGVLPPGFSFPLNVSDAEMWTPAALDADLFSNRGLHLALVVGRLKADSTLAQAQADMDIIARRGEQAHPDSNVGHGVRLVPLHEHVVGDVRLAALVLLGAVGLVLLIACTNVANLLLAHSAHREQELGIRAALGAGRRRLIRQVLTESGLLAMIGGALGVLLALWGMDALVALLPAEVPRRSEIAVDGRVLMFALAVSMATGLGFGLAPALNAAQGCVHRLLKEGSRTTAGVGHRRLGDSLVICEIALALVLLMGAGLLIRSFHRLTRVDYGFDPNNVLTFRMSIPFSSYSDPVGRAQLYREVVTRVGALPGVRSVGGAALLPLAGFNVSLTLDIAGRPDPPPGEEYSARSNSVTPGYFHTMNIALRRGRLFTDEDVRSAPGVAIINETLASRYWPNENPIGQRITPSARLGDDDPESYEIIGIVSDAKARGLDRGAPPCVYFPYEQQTWPFMSFVVRTTADPLALVGAVRGEVAGATREEAAFSFKTMAQYAAESTGDRWFPTVLLSVFAALAVVLATMGIYAMLSYSVARRRHEIGVRMAMGANKADVLRMVLAHGVLLTVIGLAIGVGASLASGRLLSSLLYEIGTADPATIVGASFLLGIIALVACFVPAGRAATVDPVVALRYE